MWDRHSLKTRPSLVKPTCNASPKTKDSRVFKPENWVSNLRWITKMGADWIIEVSWLSLQELHDGQNHNFKDHKCDSRF